MLISASFTSFPHHNSNLECIDVVLWDRNQDHRMVATDAMAASPLHLSSSSFVNLYGGMVGMAE